MKQSINPEERCTKANKAERLVRTVIAIRRKEAGFKSEIRHEAWAHAEVKAATYHAATYLVRECCAAEWESLHVEPRPDDEGLEEALVAIERALNGLMSFSEAIERHVSRAEAQDGDKAVAQESDVTQETNTNAASDYLHWLLEWDDWVQLIRKNFPQPMTEKEAVDLMLSPLAQVLSFEDFERLEISPRMAYGRITVIRQETRKNEFGRESPACEFQVDVVMPNGGMTSINVWRIGDLAHFQYQSVLLTEYWKRINQVACHEDKLDMWKRFSPDDPFDEQRYPKFPHFTFQGYFPSVCGYIIGLCESLVENSFYPNKSAAFRLLLLHHQDALFTVNFSQDMIFLSEMCAFLDGNYHLKIPPWTMPEELADLWRRARPDQARTRRMPSPENVTLFRFVITNTPPGGKPRWADLARQWNQEQGERFTREKVFKTFFRVRAAFFPNHPIGKFGC